MTTSVKVSAKYQIAVPQVARRKLNIKQGDRLLVDVQDGVIVLIPQPKRHTDYLQIGRASCRERVYVLV